MVVTKDRVELSNSAWAQGGIAGVLDPADAISQSCGRHDDRRGRDCATAPSSKRSWPKRRELIRELVTLGAEFDLVDGQIALTHEGGHSHARVAHALGDATGKEVMRALIDRSAGCPASISGRRRSPSIC